MQRRALLFPALALAHLGLLMLVLYAPAAPSRPLAPAMAVTAVPDAGVIAQAAPPPETRDIMISVAAPDFAVAPDLQPVSLAAAPGAAKAGCELAADVQAALRQSPAVAAAVMHIPVAARSVSNALLLWESIRHPLRDVATIEMALACRERHLATLAQRTSDFERAEASALTCR